MKSLLHIPSHAEEPLLKGCQRLQAADTDSVFCDYRSYSNPGIKLLEIAKVYSRKLPI